MPFRSPNQERHSTEGSAALQCEKSTDTRQQESAGNALQSDTECTGRSQSGRVDSTQTLLSHHLQRLHSTADLLSRSDSKEP